MHDPRHEKAYAAGRRKERQAARRATGVEPVTTQAPGGLGATGAGPRRVGYPSLDAALHAYPGSHVRILHQLGGEAWYKLALRAHPWPKHYIIVCVATEVPLDAGLEQLDAKAGAFLAGYLKPSPD
jgi:hypothetical protein